MAKTFEELMVWQHSRELAILVHFTVADLNDFSFKNQMNNAAVSVMNNIAEGFERYSKADFKRFLQIAKASNGEVCSMSYLAEDFRYIEPDKGTEIRNKSRQVKSEIISLMNSL